MSIEVGKIIIVVPLAVLVQWNRLQRAERHYALLKRAEILIFTIISVKNFISISQSAWMFNSIIVRYALNSLLAIILSHDQWYNAKNIW